jgi:hypothetical protein
VVESAPPAFCPFITVATAAAAVKVGTAAESALLASEALDAAEAPELSVEGAVALLVAFAAASPGVTVGALAFWLGVTAGFATLVAASCGLPRLAVFVPAPAGTLPLVFAVLEFVTPEFAVAEFVAVELPPVVPAAAAPPAGGELEVPFQPPAPLAGVCDCGGLAGSVFVAVELVAAAGAGACCGGGLTGVFAAGADASASSNAANGVASSGSLSWPDVDG